MVVAQTLFHRRTDRDFLDRLAVRDWEHPVAAQIGGDDPRALAEAASIMASLGYDEINLNVGCPSDRVKQGRFGACLMKTPDRVAAIIQAIGHAVDVPVTVKHRIGVDDDDSWQFFEAFVGTLAEAGNQVFVIHARKAWLEGLSPAQNRSVPPLRHDWVVRIKQQFPHLTIVLNGGITTLDDVKHKLDLVDGVMIGRAAVNDPFLFRHADTEIFGADQDPDPNIEEFLTTLEEYTHSLRESEGSGIPMLRHCIGLFKGYPNARLWRQALAQMMRQSDSFSLGKLFDDAIGRPINAAEHPGGERNLRPCP